MKFAFILDPLDQLKAYKDSSIAMMRAAARRGHEVFAIQRDALVWDGGTVSAQALAITPTDVDDAWVVAQDERERANLAGQHPEDARYRGAAVATGPQIRHERVGRQIGRGVGAAGALRPTADKLSNIPTSGSTPSRGLMKGERRRCKRKRRSARDIAV